MSSEIRRSSADDPGETAASAPASDHHAVHWPYQELTRQELDDLPDYDGEVPPPLEGADPGNEDPGEPAETTGLGEGYHSAEEYRAWLAARNARNGGAAGDGRASGDDQAAPADESGDREGTRQEPEDHDPAPPEADADASRPADASADGGGDGGGDGPRPPDGPDDGDDTVVADHDKGEDGDKHTRRLEKIIDSQDRLIGRLESEVNRLEARIAELEAKDEEAEGDDAVTGAAKTLAREDKKVSDKATDWLKGHIPSKTTMAIAGSAATFTEAILAASHLLSSPMQALITAGAGLGGALIGAARDHYKGKKKDG